MKKFDLKSEYKPAGDQPQAIKKLVGGLEKGDKHQTLLGVTGSGKTFTMANVIQQVQKPTLVIAHNKTLAAQLAQEYKDFFPNNAVHYFVSYYDYYQPEAYKPVTDTYIEKEAMVNAEIERLRHASTQALLTRKDVIIVASVSCIYGLGSPEEYEKVNFKFFKGMKLSRGDFIRKLTHIYFERTNADLEPGQFRAIGQSVEIMPVSEKFIVQVQFDADQISYIQRIDGLNKTILEEDIKTYFLFPTKHFVANEDVIKKALKSIQSELDERLKQLTKEGKNLEAERLKRRTRYDMAMIREVGYCNGIENYSRHFDGRLPDETPNTLLDYFPKTKDGKADFLTVIDESHVAVPQIGGMYAGDRSRKETLVEHGFRLPSAKDNRPLRFEEFEKKTGQKIYTSATPGKYENENSSITAEQIIRPTGLVDPQIEIKPIVEKGKYKGQVFDFIAESEKEIKKGGRVLVTTLTKKMAEDLSEYLKEKKIKSEYIHSDVKTIDRIDIISNFRRGEFDILVGVNLLREGLDMPEVTMIGILDADKEGFLRSETALIQTIGRAARNVDGRVILYADEVTGSMKRAIEETDRRRTIQLDWNKKHNITPKTIIKTIKDITEQMKTEHQSAVDTLMKVDADLAKKNPEKLMKRKEKQMNAAAKMLDFETAAILRDEIKQLEEIINKDKKDKEKEKATKKRSKFK
ncbi:excinuclease ABC subunit UvrB [Candidatus Parcubacteria bacterium]|nr:excinuclease ABC subunit UvrB [Candidatus Parcubacteria bacterium]